MYKAAALCFVVGLVVLFITETITAAIRATTKPEMKCNVIPGNYWTTAKAGTVLEIKTMIKVCLDGDTYYMRDNAWFPVLSLPN